MSRAIVVAIICTSVVAVGGTATVYVVKPELLGIPVPEQTIRKFVKAYNEEDFNTLLTCIDPRLERAAKGLGNVIGSLLGVNPSDLLEMVPFLVKAFGEQPGDIRIENVRIVDKVVEESQAHVAVSFDQRYIANDRQRIDHAKLLLRLEKYDDGWRIMDMQALAE